MDLPPLERQEKVYRNYMKVREFEEKKGKSIDEMMEFCEKNQDIIFDSRKIKAEIIRYSKKVDNLKDINTVHKLGYKRAKDEFCKKDILTLMFPL